MNTRFHHVSVMASNLDKSFAFYTQALGLEKMPRPTLSRDGAWLGKGDVIVHLIVNPDGTCRPRKVIKIDDFHFALRVEDFDAAVTHFLNKGFRETDDENDPQRMIVYRTSPVGFPQIYIMDPDNNVIEINAV
jgi:catechol 2,3-dioxygenase-like lactoylglutathione lyase family enzyme